jgi:hypothetical protein
MGMHELLANKGLAWRIDCAPFSLPWLMRAKFSMAHLFRPIKVIGKLLTPIG